MKENKNISVTDNEEQKNVLKVEIDCITPPDENQREKIRDFMQ